MSKVKTISDAQENSIADALAKLRRLESVSDLMHNNTYRAAQRDILRGLVRHVISQSESAIELRPAHLLQAERFANLS